MKKAILSFFLSLALSGAMAQNCTPDQSISAPGYYPESLPTGIVGQYYSQSVQFRIPADTNVIFAGNSVNAIIDSLKVMNVLNLPTGLAYACNPASCGLPGGKTSCGNIYGTIDESVNPGFFSFVIPIRIHAKVNGILPVQQVDTLFNLGMEVSPSTGVKLGWFDDVKVFPNPANRKVEVHFPVGAESMEVKVLNAAGKEVMLTWNKEMNKMSTDLSELPAGYYFATANGAQGAFRFGFVKVDR